MRFARTVRLPVLAAARALHKIPRCPGPPSNLVLLSSSGVKRFTATTLDNSVGPAGKASDYHRDCFDPKKPKAELYDGWAETYDADMTSVDYQAPRVVAKMVVEHLTAASAGKTVEILDAGCGTGFVGEELLKQLKGAGVSVNLTGCDISQGMIDKALRRGYTECMRVDMNQPLEYDSSKFHAVSCAGTFIGGHVYAEPGLPELVRVTKPGGIVIATCRLSFFDEAYEAAIKTIEAQGATVELIDFQYADGVVGKLMVIKKA